MNCKFIKIDDGRYQCSICKFVIKSKFSADKIYRNCTETPTMTTIEKIESAVSTVKDFVASGLEISNTEEKNKRIEICKECEHYNNGNCRLCGCNMNLKTRIDSAHCPIGKW